MSGDGSGRDLRGRFSQGAKPGPGRPQGFRGVAKLIMAETHDGAALVSYAMQVWTDPASTAAAKWAAFEWLSDRGMGKSVNVVDLSVENTTTNVLPASFHELPEAERARLLDAIEVPSALGPGK